MKIRRRRGVYVCNNIDEVISILNSSYETLHVKDIDWYNSNKDSNGTVKVPFSFVNTMVHLFGKTINGFRAEKYHNCIRIQPYEEEYRIWSWSLNMFEEFEDFIIKKDEI